MIDWKWVGIIVGTVAVIAVVILGISIYKNNTSRNSDGSNVVIDTNLNNHIDINPVIPADPNSGSKESSGMTNLNQPANQVPWQQGPSVVVPENTPWGKGPSQ